MSKTNDEIYLELRKVHRRQIAAVAVILWAALLISMAIAFEQLAIVSAVLILFAMLLCGTLADALVKGGYVSQIIQRLPGDFPKSEPELEAELEAADE